MTKLRLLDMAAIASTVEAARSSRRGRANHNLHPTLVDPVQRFLNVFQPGSYVRPHRHEAKRWELFLLLEGDAAALVFDDSGNVVETARLRRGGPRAVEVAGGAWHTLLAIARNTMLFEVKPGPYTPLTDKDFAPWAPAEGTPESRDLLARWSARVSASTR